MSNSGWAAGRGAGLTWTQCFATADLSSLATAHSVLSSQGDIANGTPLDQLADVAFELWIPSTTLATGAALTLCLYDAFQIDGSTTYYGDNSLPTAGSQVAYNAAYNIVGSFAPTITGAAQTVVTGKFKQIVLPPTSFRFALVNNLNVTIDASGTHTSYVSYITYNTTLSGA